MAFDSKGDVYVTESNNARIQVFTAEGKFLRKFGNEGNGDGEFNTPIIGICIDREDVVYVIDCGNNRVSLFKCDGEPVKPQFLKSFGSQGSGLGQFNGPHGIALDKDKNVYVADQFNNRI